MYTLYKEKQFSIISITIYLKNTLRVCSRLVFNGIM